MRDYYDTNATGLAERYESVSTPDVHESWLRLLPSTKSLILDVCAGSVETRRGWPVILSGVWMHVPPSGRKRAFRKLADLLRPDGIIMMALRDGSREGGMHPVIAELINFADR